jgi:phenylpropionate dioxygenase-like ring-hydroxylating dioxygenase large terminal subunit
MAGMSRLMPGDAEAPRAQWYVIAFSDEVTRAPRARMIMGDPVVLFRREDGSPVALFDRCPHRGMRLSNGGKLIDDNIQCNYHGLQFGPDGMCRKVPSGGPISNQMRVRSYPVIQIWNWIWIWPGDPDKADPALIPDHHELGLTDPSLHAYSGLMLEMECNYLHAYENLNEASHVSYLHHGFIDTGNVAAHPFREEVTEDRVSTIREFKDERVFPYAKMSYGLKSDVVDRQLKLTAIAPTLTTVSEKYQEKGVENPRELLVRLVVPVTPASHKKCYQFVAAVRTLPAEPVPLFEGLRGFLQEDQVALADVQELFDSLPPEQRIEVSVKADNPAWRTRRILERMIKEERAAPAAAAAAT